MKSVAIVQYEDRDDPLLMGLIRRNAEYCQAHGYQHIFIQRVSEDIPPWWVKCFILREILKKDFDFVTWLDSDAVVHDQARTIESLFIRGESLIFSPDAPAWNNPSPFNAGVLIFKSNPTAQKIIEDWIQLFNWRRWTKEGGEWHTPGPWAGEDYEQGAFVRYLLPSLKTTTAVREEDWQVLQGPWVMSQSFTMHFANRSRPNAAFYLNLTEKYSIRHGVEVSPKT